MVGFGHGKQLARRAVLLSLVLAFFLGGAMAILAPFFENRAEAAGTAINLPQRGGKINTRQNRDVAFGTCEPYWDRTVKTRDFLAQQFYSKMDDLPYEAKDNAADEWNWLVNEYDERTIESRIGHDFGHQAVFGDDQPKIDRAARMLQQMGKQEIPVIRFRAASAGSTPLDGNYSSNSSVCGSYYMIPVDYPTANNRAGSWRGFEFFNEEYGGYNPEKARGEYMEFKLTGDSTNVGSFSYWTKKNGGELLEKLDGRTLMIDGTYPSGSSPGNNPNVGTINATWVDAATISINNSRQNFAGEVYKKRSWNTREVGGTAYSYYFLDKASPGRENLAWGNNSKKCEDALPLNTACGGGGICVPFIAVKQKLNVSHNDGNLQGLQNNINQLGGAQAELYDFNSGCVPDARYTIALSGGDNAKIWLYYSSQQKAFMPVFTTGDGNEVKYVGTYAEFEAPEYGPSGLQRTGKYRLGECMATIQGNPLQTGPNETFGVNWSLTDGNCANLRTYGTLNVMAKGGAAGEEAFGNNQEEAQNNTDAGESEAKFICNLTSNPFSWIFCPLTRLALEGIDALEAVINDTLTVKTDRVFNDKFYKIWAGFRTLALALIAIAALIMVVSQAAGIEILDAYTIKKVLPRLLFAAIAITVSWAVMQFLVTLSNDVGLGIRYLIYSPFPNTTDLGGVAFTGFLVALLSGGALLALGLLGMLSFILTALVAAAVAFGVIVFRELLLIALVASAPLWLACKVLPGTEKGYEMGKNAFVAVLVVFPIITVFISTGRVFAIVAVESGGNETLNQIIAIFAYILPYFLITTAFRLAGGIMSTVGGLMNDRSKGAFDRLRNYRSNKMEERGKRFKEGRLYDSDNFLFRPGRRGPLGWYADKANKLGERKGLGWRRGMYGFGERGRQASSLHSMVEAEHERKNNQMLEALANSDDAGMLVLAASGGNARRARAFVDDRIRSGKWDANKGEEAYKAAMAVGINRGTAIASLQKLAENKSREIDPGDVATIKQAIADVSEGNTVLGDKLSWDFQFRSRTAGGRADLGGVWHTPEKLAEANQLAASMARMGGATNWEGRAYANPNQAGITAEERSARLNALTNDASGVVAYFDGVDRTSVQQALAGHPNEVKQLNHAVKTALKYGDAKQKEKAALAAYEMHKGLAAGQASGANREEVSRFLSELGVDTETLKTAGISIEDALAAKVGEDPLPAYDINGRRIIDPATGNEVHRQYTGAMLTARARAFDTQAQRGQIMNPEP